MAHSCVPCSDGSWHVLFSCVIFCPATAALIRLRAGSRISDEWRLPRKWSVGRLSDRVQNRTDDRTYSIDTPLEVKGVGTQIVLTYVLTIEDPQRFLKNRAVGCFLGCDLAAGTPGRANRRKVSAKKETGICARDDGAGSTLHSGAFGEDGHLRRWGRKLAERGGKNAK